LRERKMDCSIRKRKKVKDKNSDKKIVIVKLKILNKNGEKLRGIKKIRKKEKRTKATTTTENMTILATVLYLIL
jgi:hypothetical protein